MSPVNLEWSDDFLIGISELDYEHKSLIDDINRLHQELVGHDTADHIKQTLGSIHARMQAHFALEEHVMKSNDYPFFDEHKREHEGLLDQYTEFMVRFRGEQSSPEMQEIEEMLGTWIIKHIQSSDVRMSLMLSGEKA